MSNQLESAETQALKLTAEERAQFADRVITSDRNLAKVVREKGGQAILTPHPRRKTKPAPS